MCRNIKTLASVLQGRKREKALKGIHRVINNLSSRSYCWHRMKRYQLYASDTFQKSDGVTVERKNSEKVAKTTPTQNNSK